MGFFAQENTVYHFYDNVKTSERPKEMKGKTTYSADKNSIFW